MRKPVDNLMRLGVWIGGLLAVLLAGGCLALALMMLLAESANAGAAAESLWTLLPRALSIAAFTVTTSVASVVLTFPMAWSLASVTAFRAGPNASRRLQTLVSCLSAIPAVVFGYMSLTYLTPGIDSAWWSVTVTLMLMSLMRLTLTLIHINQRHAPAVEAAQALGALMSETLLRVVLPRAWREYAGAALRLYARCMSEGVAILMVLLVYSGRADTLATALMKGMGVTQEAGSARWVVLLTLVLLALVLIDNALISVLEEGGRHGKKNAEK